MASAAQSFRIERDLSDDDNIVVEDIYSGSLCTFANNGDLKSNSDGVSADHEEAARDFAIAAGWVVIA